MKRISYNLTAIYGALFRDLSMWGPGVPLMHERDLSRLCTLVETRGERTLLVDFPRYAKSFDKACSRGRIDCQDFPLLGKEVNGVPQFMGSLFERVFTCDGSLRPSPCVQSVRNIRQVLGLCKKVKVPLADDKITEEVHAFFSTDRALRAPSSGWNTGVFDASVSLMDAVLRTDTVDLFGRQCAGISSRLVDTCQRVADNLLQRFLDFDPDAIVGRHGPGAVADLASGMDKYVFPTWPQRLERVFPRDIHAAANVRLFDYESTGGSCEDRGSLRCDPAKLIPVAKTLEKPRLIASEPTANQFIQGGINQYLRRCIASGPLKGCLSLNDQEPSRVLALQASMDPQLATVDLSSASDRLSCWTVERFFRSRPEILEALAASRSPWIVDKKYTGEYSLLRKYAPQGNATTFPVQSIIYASIALAACIWSDPGWGKQCRSFDQLLKLFIPRIRIFGDDIIVPTYALPALSSLLELCQLKVNGDKSHYSGNFAESCGMDAFKGTDVTPVYLSYIDDVVSPSAVVSVVEVANNLYREGLIHTSEVVLRLAPEHVLRMLPVSNQQGLPLSLFSFSTSFFAKRRRYNHHLHRVDFETLVPEVKVTRKSRESWENLLQFFVENPDPTITWSSGWVEEMRFRLKRRWVAEPG